MTAPGDDRLGDAPTDLPRRNGELVFEAPWESRAFGLTAAYLASTGRPWAEFRPRLIAAIANRPPETPYYEAWTAALVELLIDDAVVSSVELEARAAAVPD